MKFIDIFKKKELNIEKIATNSSSFIKSICTLDIPEDYIGFKLYMSFLEGINSYKIGKAKTFEYIEDVYCESFKLSSKTDEYKKAIIKMENSMIKFNPIIMPNGEKIPVIFNTSSLIKRWMELQDDFLIPSIKKNMYYSDSLIENILNSLSVNQLKFAENILFHFYEDYLNGNITGLSLDEIVRREYNIEYTTNIPFKKYSYTQLVENILWSDDVYENYNKEIDNYDDVNYDEIGDEQIREKIEFLWENSLLEVCSKNFTLYNSRSINNFLYSSKIGDKHKIVKYKLLDVSIFNSLIKYVHELEAFKNLIKQKVDFLIIDDKEFKNSIKINHGKAKYKYLLKLIDSVYLYGGHDFQSNIY